MKISVSIPDGLSQTLLKDAKKKAIEEDVSLSEAIVILLGKWVNGKVSLEKKK